MSYRQLRIILFFDLPSVTTAEKKHYRKFHKFLKSEGFIMLQESVYSKLVLNSGSAKFIERKVEQNKPPDGIIQILTITEKQFAGIEYVIGQSSSKVIDSTERLIII